MCLGLLGGVFAFLLFVGCCWDCFYWFAVVGMCYLCLCVCLWVWGGVGFDDLGFDTGEMLLELGWLGVGFAGALVCFS